MDERTRRAIGIIAAIALFGGGGIGLLLIYLAAPEPPEPAAVIAPMEPPTDEMRQRAHDEQLEAVERAAAERLEVLRQLEAVEREAQGLANEVREMGRQQEAFDEAADALERRIEKLEQRR